ncbi:MAG: tRNA (adenosine(37)-N6)-threonylcarbamoyltransferase complex dimerization subunit type 1 TsaB [Gemmataceae bacterium]|nr:tRNA (adenosine(37)-N6)-threonylcarbamoyltransferase complex dimerization subunit type 1 TsaB [Gemmataceae bacterium]
MTPYLLLLETSHRIGQIALALGDTIVGERSLDESRRHARDLVPAVHALLGAQGIKARDLAGVFVSRGPGSYTGLRVGIMSAKTLAYATGCALLAIDTFAAIRAQVPAEFADLDVLADAQQDRVYVQRFGSNATPLRIVKFDDWLAETRDRNRAVAGPALETLSSRIVGVHILPGEYWYATPAGLLAIGWDRFTRGERDDHFAIEPLYLRASEAELKWSASLAP